MPLRDRRRLLVGGAVALALIGLWLGHTLEYMRVLGTAGLNTELFGSVHAYMLPLGAALAFAAATGGLWLWRLWSALGRRVDGGRAAIRSLFRGRPVQPPGEPPSSLGRAPSFWAGVLVAWPALALLQIALYIFQENAEALAGGVRAPGLGAVSGVHWMAPFVHAAVAFVLVTIAAAVVRLLGRRVQTVARIEAVLRALLRARRLLPQRLSAPASRDLRAPFLLLGLQRRQRPPPTLFAL
ncbi:MAG: hypothetical protein ACREN2_11600 [Candidatus Dormibacteria bacterium]